MLTFGGNPLMPGFSVKLAVCVLFGLIAICAPAGYLASQVASLPITTEDRLLSPGWWPRKGSEPRDRYLGSAACASCHTRIVDTQKTTPIASASVPAGSVFAKSRAAGPLTLDPLTFSVGAYKFSVTPDAEGPVYSASDGAQSVSTPLGWVFGSGHFGQTYLYEQRGSFYESTLSYYPAIRGLDFTTGHARSAPASLAKALGEPQTPEAIRACFGCHTTAATVATVSIQIMPRRESPAKPATVPENSMLRP
jgi:cytochrome c553